MYPLCWLWTIQLSSQHQFSQMVQLVHRRRAQEPYAKAMVAAELVAMPCRSKIESKWRAVTSHCIPKYTKITIQNLELISKNILDAGGFIGNPWL